MKMTIRVKDEHRPCSWLPSPLHQHQAAGPTAAPPPVQLVARTGPSQVPAPRSLPAWVGAMAKAKKKAPKKSAENHLGVKSHKKSPEKHLTVAESDRARRREVILSPRGEARVNRHRLVLTRDHRHLMDTTTGEGYSIAESLKKLQGAVLIAPNYARGAMPLPIRVVLDPEPRHPSWVPPSSLRDLALQDTERRTAETKGAAEVLTLQFASELLDQIGESFKRKQFGGEEFRRHFTAMTQKMKKPGKS